MTSNAYSKIRQTLRRPKVCKTPPPPPPPPPAPVITCTLALVPSHGTPPLNVTVQWASSNSGLPNGDPETVKFTMQHGTINGHNPDTENINNGAGGTVTWKLLAAQAPSTITALYTWSDGNTCSKTLTFTTP